MKNKYTHPPAHIVSAFTVVENIESLGAILTEEGFDQDTVRVLAAWSSSEHRWVMPRSPCPDEGRSTAAAWRWLVSGWDLDVAGVAQAADVSMPVARAKLDLLVANRLIFPDGQMAKVAKAMIQAAIRKALGGRKKKQEDGQPPTAVSPGKAGAAN